MSDPLHYVELFAFDLDGTLYVGDAVVKGAASLLADLRRNRRVVFFTNNSTKTTDQIKEKLHRLGLGGTSETIYTSAAATAMFLVESGIRRVFLIGTNDFAQELARHGIACVADDSTDTVVVGLDPCLTYGKIATALGVLQRGGKFIACNEDPAFPIENGKVLPGCGAIVAAIATAAGRPPDFVAGKPNIFFLQRIASAYRIPADRIAVVGDSVTSDMGMSIAFGSQGILIGGIPPSDARIRQFPTLEEFHNHLRSLL